jgi:hypothetical protein
MLLHFEVQFSNVFSLLITVCKSAYQLVQHDMKSMVTIEFVD